MCTMNYTPKIGDKMHSLKNRGEGKIVEISDRTAEFLVSFTGSEWFYPHRAWFKFSEIGSEIAPVAL